MSNELPTKKGLISVLLLIALAILIGFFILVFEQEKDDTLYELYDPIEPQEIRDFRK